MTAQAVAINITEQYKQALTFFVNITHDMTLG